MAKQGKQLQVFIDNEAAGVLELLKSANTKSLFTSLAIKSYANSEEAQFLLKAKKGIQSSATIEAQKEKEETIEKEPTPKMREW